MKRDETVHSWKSFGKCRDKSKKHVESEPQKPVKKTLFPLLYSSLTRLSKFELEIQLDNTYLILLIDVLDAVHIHTHDTKCK